MGIIIILCREKLKSHTKRHTDLQAKHEEFKKDVSELDEQLELINRDSAALENAFDELHQQYVKEKAVHQCLTDRSKVIQHYSAELKSWTQEDMQSRDQLQAQLQELEQKYVLLRTYKTHCIHVVDLWMTSSNHELIISCDSLIHARGVGSISFPLSFPVSF